MPTSKKRPDLQGINKQKTDHGSMTLFKKGGAMKETKGMKKSCMPMIMKDGKKMPAFAVKKGGMPKFAKGGAIDGIAQKGKTRGKVC